MQLIATDKPSVIVGMGLTGMSVARYLVRLGESFVLMDTRENPPEKALNDAQLIQKSHAKMSIRLGELDEDILLNAKQIILSPGIAKNHPAVEKAKSAGIPILGDVDLFLNAARRFKQIKIIGVTGSNGKSTVVTLLGLAISKAGKNVEVAGNIGVPVCDLLIDGFESTDIVVLELSSFQLEIIRKAQLDVACVLNVSADHMDRYPSLAHYCQAKLRIYFGAKNIVYNVNDTLTIPPFLENTPRFGFSINKPIEENQLPVYVDKETKKIVVGDKSCMHINNIKIKGSHNIQNALAVFAILRAADIDLDGAVQALTEFNGLPHRCQTILEHNNVTYINDSKATNIGSAIAAVEGLATNFTRIILIAGGDAKNADFKSFAKSVNKNVCVTILLGKDSTKIETALIQDNSDIKSRIIKVELLEQAVNEAVALAQNFDVVLLSPACASLDMFANFEERGELFSRYVKEVACA